MKSAFSLISGLPAVVFGIACGAGCAPAETFLRSDVAGGVLEVAATDVSSHAVMIEASSSWMFDTFFGAPHEEGTSRWASARYDSNNPALMWVETLGRNENPEPRLDTVVVVSGDGLRLEILVRQGALEVSFGVAPASIEPFGPRESDTRTVSVSSTIAWEYEVVDRSDWLTVARSDDPDSASGTLTVAAAPTRSLDPRRDTIVVRPANQAFHAQHTHKIPVEQAGIDLIVESEKMNTSTFAVEIPAAGGEIPLWVYSRAGWTASVNAPPERAALDITSGPADIESGIPVVMTAAANPSTEQFEFTLTLTSAGQKYEYICIQQGRPEESGTE